MATYRVGFDGRWQGDFNTEQAAREWAEAVAAQDRRFVYVVREGRFGGRKLLAVFGERSRERSSNIAPK
jgi:hypothetical protein